MSIELITLIMFGSLIIGLALGLPLAFLLGGIAVVCTYFLWGPKAITMIVLQTFDWSKNFLVMAIPLFIFMGLLLQRSGVAERLYEMMYRWAGRLRGGLAIGTVGICTIFAAMTGITGAATVTMGIIALPAMLKRNYNRGLAMGSIATGGTLGILIPPSVMFIILGLVTQVSVGKLFAGGIFSGLALSLLIMSYIGIRAFLQPQLAPASPEKYTWREKISSVTGIIAPLLLILAVLGAIFGGVATPTEAAAVGAFGALICVFAYGRFSWKLLSEVCYSTLRLSCMVIWILIGAACFVSIYTSVGATELIRETIVGLEVNRWLVLIGTMFVVFIMGMFLDPGGIIMLAAPIFYPIVTALGFDPILFGVLFVINLQIGYITPPFGFNLFYLKSVAPPDMTMGEIYINIYPFVAVLIVGMAMVMVFPQLATWLPSIIVK